MYPRARRKGKEGREAGLEGWRGEGGRKEEENEGWEGKNSERQ